MTQMHHIWNDDQFFDKVVLLCQSELLKISSYEKIELQKI